MIIPTILILTGAAIGLRDDAPGWLIALGIVLAWAGAARLIWKESRAA